MKLGPIGTFTLAESKRYTNHYDYAAWWQEVEVQAGTYPAYAIVEDEHVKWIVVTLPGIVTGSHFGAYYGGVCIAPSNDKDKGERAEYHIQLYPYQVFEANGAASPWSIDLSKLPNIGTCEDCGKVAHVYADRPTLCAPCFCKREDRDRRNASSRWPRLKSLLDRTGRYKNQGSAILVWYSQKREEYFQNVVRTAVQSRHAGRS